MLKSHLNIRSSPELCDLQRFFLSQIDIPEQKVTPVELTFYNFVCYAAEMLSQFSKSHLQITLDVFLVDQHLRRYPSTVEMYRRFIGFVKSWKKYGDSDQGKLLTTFLQKGRNERKSVKLFLRLRKILLKNINQKILQDIKLNHQDAVTIIHTLDMITSQQKRILTKKINDHFISKNVKHPNSIILNAAVLCEYLITEINDKRQDKDRFQYNLSSKLTKILENQTNYIEEFSQDSIQYKEDSFDHEECQNQFLNESNLSSFQEASNKQNWISRKSQNEQSKKSLVSLEKCMKELYILKEKDLQIDNRFKKLSKVREDHE